MRNAHFQDLTCDFWRGLVRNARVGELHVTFGGSLVRIAPFLKLWGKSPKTHVVLEVSSGSSRLVQVWCGSVGGPGSEVLCGAAKLRL